MQAAHDGGRVRGQVEPGRAGRHRVGQPVESAGTASTSAGPGSDVKTTSLAAPTAAGLSAQVAPRLQQRLGRLPADVVADQLVARRLQMPGHVAAHRAQADEADVHCAPPGPSASPWDAATRAAWTIPAVMAAGQPA